MGDRFVCDVPLAPALAAAGLRNAADLLQLGGSATHHHMGTFLELPVAGTCGRFYLKRYAYPGWGASWGLLGRGTLWGTAPELNEFRALAWLRGHGLPAAKPIAAAARRHAGRLVAHALLTEVVEGAVDLDRRLHDPADPLRVSRGLRRRFLQRLGEVIGRMHALGFRHRDLHARNVLVQAEDDEVALWLIDCRRGGRGLRQGPHHDLACLDRDLRGLLTRGDRRRLLGAYLAPGGDAKAVVRRVAAIRDALPGERRTPAAR
jgi:tRNA A-37 threonylcarbamoyl transferase component Bud32